MHKHAHTRPPEHRIALRPRAAKHVRGNESRSRHGTSSRRPKLLLTDRTNNGVTAVGQTVECCAQPGSRIRLHHPPITDFHKPGSLLEVRSRHACNSEGHHTRARPSAAAVVDGGPRDDLAWAGTEADAERAHGRDGWSVSTVSPSREVPQQRPERLLGGHAPTA